jgi:hypothetical protein
LGRRRVGSIRVFVSILFAFVLRTYFKLCFCFYFISCFNVVSNCLDLERGELVPQEFLFQFCWNSCSDFISSCVGSTRVFVSIALELVLRFCFKLCFGVCFKLCFDLVSNCVSMLFQIVLRFCFNQAAIPRILRISGSSRFASGFPDRS